MSGADARLTPWPAATRFQFAHRAPEYWMPHFERNFGDRSSTKRRWCMRERDGEPLALTIEFPNRSMFDVEGARPFFARAGVHFFFNLENPCQQLSGIFSVSSSESAIQEPGWAVKFDWFSFVER